MGWHLTSQLWALSWGLVWRSGGRGRCCDSGWGLGVGCGWVLAAGGWLQALVGCRLQAGWWSCRYRSGGQTPPTVALVRMLGRCRKSEALAVKDHGASRRWALVLLG